MSVCQTTRSKLHHYTPEDDAMIRRYYNSGEMQNKDLAAKLGVTGPALKYHASCLGLTRRNIMRTFRRFDEQDDITIHKMVGDYTIGSIAERLGRSPQAILDRMSHLGLRCSAESRDGWYTCSDVAMILGMNDTTVRNMIRRGTIKARTHWGKETAYGGGRECWHITREDLREFICKYPTTLNGRPVDFVQLVDVLAEVKAI